MTSYDLSGIDALPSAARTPQPNRSGYNLSGIDALPGIPPVWAPADPGPFIALGAFGRNAQQPRYDKLASELRGYLGDEAPVVNKYTIDLAERRKYQLEMDHVLRHAPYTTKWYANEIARGRDPYDAKVLAGIEEIVTGGREAAGRVTAAIPGDVLTAPLRVLGGLTSFAGGLEDTVYQALGIDDPSLRSKVGALVSKFAESYQDPIPEGAGNLERGFRSGIQSAAETVPLFGLGALGAATKAITATQATNLVSGVMAGRVGGQTYRESVEVTDDPARSFLNGLLDAAAEYYGEKYGGTGALFSNATWAKGFLGGLVKFAAKEIPSELATEFTQHLNDWAITHPEKSAGQFLSELPDLAVQTLVGTLVGGTVQVGVVKGVEHLAGTASGQAAAEADAAAFRELFRKVQESQLFENSPESFGQFFQSVTEGAEVWIDQDFLRQTVEEAGLSLDVLPSVQEQLGVPGDVAVPVAELIPALAGTGVEQKVIENLRRAPDAPTMVEAKEDASKAMELFAQRMERVVAKQRDAEQFKSELDAIKSEIKADLEFTQVVPPSARNAYATLVGHGYATLASRLGVTPIQIRDGWVDANGVEHTGYNLRTLGPGGLRGRSVAQEQDFAPGNIVNILNRDKWAILTAENAKGKTMSPEENAARQEALKAELDKRGLKYEQIEGKYTPEGEEDTAPLEHPFLVYGIDLDTARELGDAFEQDSILTRHGLVYGDGTVNRAKRVIEHKTEPKNYWSRIPSTGAMFTIDPDFDNRVPLADVLNQSVSTRTPKPKAGREDPHLSTGLDVELKALDGEPEFKRKLADAMLEIPGIKTTATDPDQILEDAIQHMVNNLLWLHDQVPEAVRQRAKLWYVGGRRIVDRWVARFQGQYTDAQMAGVLASMSPQMMWDQNVSLAERIVDIWTNHQSTAWVAKMDKVGAKIVDSAMKQRAARARKAKKEGRPPVPILPREEEPLYIAIQEIKGKALGQLETDHQRAIWIRLYDESINPRWFRAVTPEGGWLGPHTRPSGAKSTAAWGNGFDPVAKAVSILRDGSIPNISRQLGEAHKVRNFYNNLFDPTDPRSVTIDTHANAAALLLPLGGTDAIVKQSMGGLTNAATGHRGTYVVFAEAYRRAAEARGLLPREMQSIAWEAGRGLFKDTFKAADKKAENRVADLWTAYTEGKETADDARNAILRAAGGVEQPGWALSGTGLSEGGWDSSYTGQLLERGWVDGTPGTRAGDELAQTAAPAGLSVVGVHYSPLELTSINPAYYGRGYKGAERERVMSAKDSRIKNRAHFYVSTGKGVMSEAGVGWRAHVAQLNNVYDADVDPLHLFKSGTPEGMNAAESAVIDAGYAGYLTRNFGTRGAVVMFGKSIPARFIGGEKEAAAAATPVPSAAYSNTQRMRQTLVNAKDLPYGADEARWRKDLAEKYPAILAQLEASRAFDQVSGVVYRETLAKYLLPPEGELYQTAAQQIDTPEFKAWFGEWDHPKAFSSKFPADKAPVSQAYDWDNKRPLVLYHATNADFTEFRSGIRTINSSTFGEYDTYRAAIFATPDTAFAQEYLRRGRPGGNVMPIYMNIKSPMDLREGISGEVIEDLVSNSDGGLERNDFYWIEPKDVWQIFDAEFGDKVVSAAKKAGYDGAILSELDEERGDTHDVFAVFDPTQIKSAIGNRGTFDPNNPNILYQTAQPWYYSQLGRMVDGAKQQAMPAGQWKSWIAANAQKFGVKKEEIEWTGLNDWLDAQGKEKLTKYQVLDFLDANGVQIEEKVLGGTNLVTEKDLDDAEVYARRTGDWDRYEELVRRREDEQLGSNANGSGNQTVYASYQLPGGENYREFLLKLPGEGGATDFKAPHFNGEPNILAHIRANDRVDEDGKRVLFLEEVQSDWGQKGKKKGFRGEAVRHGSRIEGYTPLGYEWRKTVKAKDTFVTHQLVRSSDGGVVGEADTRIGALKKAGFTDTVPAGPFVTDTKAWTALALKRMIAYATENGYDRIAWTTGSQQAERYDLSKQVEAVYVSKTATGYDIGAMTADGIRELGKNIPEGKLEETIGKSLAEKAMAQPKDREIKYDGIDLKVGGEGMHAYYDQIVPQVAKDVLKKIGGGKVIDVPMFMAQQDEAGDYEVLREVVNQPGFDITPEMRAIVAQGLPLFQGEGQVLGGFSPSRLEIRLLAEANLSTFTHEVGHFFMTMYADVARQLEQKAQAGEALTPGEQSIVDDMNKVLEQFGVPDLGTWTAMPLDQQRPYHEQFAESWEQYILTGQAPVRGLNGLFRTLSDFMVRVYKSVKEFLASPSGKNAKLNSELASVMDRMLASEEAIAEEMDRRDLEAVFKMAADAGMTPAKFAEYMALPEETRKEATEALRARSLRDMKWLRNRGSKVLADLQKEAKEVRAAVQAEIEEEVRGEPVFQAIRWLKHGETTHPVTGEAIKVPGGNKLSIPALEEMFPPGAIEGSPDWRKLGYGQYGMLAAEGLHPDEVAEMFGFTSGRALVDALLAAPKFSDEVQGRTDQRMLEEHSDLATPEGLNAAVDEALHNAAHTKMLATELKALANFTGSVSQLNQAAKAYVAALVGSRTAKTLRPWEASAAEVRAGKAANKAMAKGERDLAAKLKRDQLVNHILTKEAYKAEAEVRQIIARFNKIAGYNDESSSVKSRDAATVNALRVILRQFGIGPERRGKTAAEYMELVKEYDPAAFARLSEMTAAIGVESRDWREVKLDDLRSLHEAVNDIWSSALRSRQIEVDGKLMALDQVEDELAAKLEEKGAAPAGPPKHALTDADKRKMTFSTYKNAMTRVELWAKRMDRGQVMGPFFRYIWAQVSDGVDTYTHQKALYLKAYSDLLDAIRPTLKRELIDAPELGYTFGKSHGGLGLAELLHAVLHTGNASNKEKLLLGYGWAEYREDGSVDTSRWDAFMARMHREGKITKAHWDFAQGVWDLLDSMKPAAQKAHRSAFGRFFAEVTAEEVITPFGTYRGGYVPASIDTEQVTDARLRALAEEENTGQQYAFPLPRHGFTEARVKHNRPLKLDLASLASHIDKVLLFSHVTEPVNDVRRILRSAKVSPLLNAADSMLYENLLAPWIQRVSTQVVETPLSGAHRLNSVVSSLRRKSGMMTMFANIPNSVQQLTGIFPAAILVKPKHLMHAFASTYTNRKEALDFIQQHSKYMLDRLSNDVILAAEAVDEILLNPTLLESAAAWSQKHAYFMQQAVDNWMAPTVWMGAWNQALEEGHSELDAQRLADSAVRNSLGSQRAIDVSRIETGTAFWRLFTQFTGYFNMISNLTLTEMANAMALKKGAGRGLYVVTLAVLAPSIVGELIMQMFRGGPDDDDKDGEYLDDWMAEVLLWGNLRYATAMAPVVGQVGNAALSAWGDRTFGDRVANSPAVAAIEAAIRAPEDLYNLIVEDKGRPSRAAGDVAALVSLALGVPAKTVAKPVGYWADVANEDVEPTDAWDALRGTLTGVASPESKE